MINYSNKHWNSTAKQWKYFASPLRPETEDISYIKNIIFKKFSNRKKINIKLCGVTPELATIQWPPQTFLTAIEQSMEMIQEVWPGDIDGKRKAIQGHWLDPEIDIHPYDVIIGDGCFISMDYPNEYNTFAKRLANSLAHDGLIAMRFFIQTENTESSDQVFCALQNGEINSFHAFKWRLAMALQSSSQQGVKLHDIYAAWQNSEITNNYLIDKRGWSENTINTINLYKHKQNHFYFATLPEILTILEKYFYVESIYYPNYELGERCPIIIGRLY